MMSSKRFLARNQKRVEGFRRERGNEILRLAIWSKLRFFLSIPKVLILISKRLDHKRNNQDLRKYTSSQTSLSKKPQSSDSNESFYVTSFIRFYRFTIRVQARSSFLHSSRVLLPHWHEILILIFPNRILVKLRIPILHRQLRLLNKMMKSLLKITWEIEIASKLQIYQWLGIFSNRVFRSQRTRTVMTFRKV